MWTLTVVAASLRAERGADRSKCPLW